MSVVEEEVLDQVEDQIEEVEEVVTDEAEQTEDKVEEVTEEQAAEEERVLGFDEPEEEKSLDNAVLRDLRKANQDKRKENRELQKRLKELEQKLAPPKVELGPKPKLADYAYDEEAFDSALDSWLEQKAEVDNQKIKEQEELNKQQQQIQQIEQSYEDGKAKVRGVDFDEAEENLSSVLDVTQQQVLKYAPSSAALMVARLHKSPQTLDKLAAIKDPIKFAVEIGKLEATAMQKQVRKAPKAEKRVSGNTTTGGIEAQLEKARKKAEASGDMTDVYRLKKKLKSQG